MRKLVQFILTVSIISCHQTHEKEVDESDESQILNLAFEKAISSDTTFRFFLRDNPPPIPTDPLTNKIDCVEYRQNIQWRDSVLKILDTASLYVVVYRKNETIAHHYVNILRDSIKKDKDDTLLNNVLEILIDQNQSMDTSKISFLNPKFNFKIYNDSLEPFDPIRKIGSLHFSKIAFNSQKNIACIHTSFSVGEWRSKGEIHFFVKKAARWLYKKKIILWSS
jgi:hypothetical protein